MIAQTQQRAELAARLDSLIADGHDFTPAGQTPPSDQWRLSFELELKRLAKVNWAARLLAWANLAKDDETRQRHIDNADRIFLEWGYPKQGWLDRKVAEFTEGHRQAREKMALFRKPDDEPSEKGWHPWERRFSAYCFLVADDDPILPPDNLYEAIMADEITWGDVVRHMNS